MILRWSWLAVIGLALLAACSGVSEETIGVRDAWSREAPGMSSTGAVFMVIENRGSQADALTGASTSVCEVVELHESVVAGEVMKMRPVEGGRIVIPAGEEVALEPGGLHVMLIGLSEQLVPGSSFTLTLMFDKAGEVNLEVMVREVGAVEMGQ